MSLMTSGDGFCEVFVRALRDYGHSSVRVTPIAQHLARKPTSLPGLLEIVHLANDTARRGDL